MNNKEHNKKMEALAEKTGLTYDGIMNSNDKEERLFPEQHITVYVYAMTEEEFNLMEKDMDAYDIRGKGFSIYAWNDSSGYDYWNREDDSNYIQVTVSIEDVDKVAPVKLKEAVENAEDYFSKYDGTDAYANNLYERQIKQREGTA